MLRYVRPVYPASAKRRKVQGTVEFRAVIAKDGSVKELTPVGGSPEADSVRGRNGAAMALSAR